MKEKILTFIGGISGFQIASLAVPYSPYVLGVFAVVFVPLVLWGLDLPIVSNTGGKSTELYELFAFCSSAMLIAVAYVELKKGKGQSLEKLLPAILPKLRKRGLGNLAGE